MLKYQFHTIFKNSTLNISPMSNFLLIDDHEIIRLGVKSVLNEMYFPCTILEADNEQSAIEQLKKNKFDLIVMDVHMPNTDTSGLLQYIINLHPESKVLIFSMSDEKIYAKKFLKQGAKGFVSKTAGLSELTHAITLVLNNRRYISETLADSLADQIGDKQTNNPFEKLSSREIDIASLLIKGVTISEISEQLNISISTVSTYKSRIFEKLKLNNISELIEMGRLYNLF